jgi:hypothetical protein
MKLLREFTLSICLLAPIAANAYVLDTNTKVITDVASGKEWLQWTETAGMSVNDDFSSFSGGGWRVATSSEMAALYSDFFSSTVNWNVREYQTATDYGSTIYGDGIDQSLVFGNLFGWTEVEDSVHLNQGFTYNLDSLYKTAAWYGTDADGDGHYNVATAYSEHRNEYRNIDYREQAALNHDYYWPHGNSNPDFGVALLREAQSVEVPEPSALALLSLGIAGIATIRKSRKRN